MIAFIPMARPTGRYFGSKSKRRTKDQEEITMQIGMIGLGRMGANMARRLIRKGHTCVVFNRSPQAVNELIKEKAIGATSLAEVVKRLEKPRAIWLMVPSADIYVTSPIYPIISRRGTFSLTAATLITSMICGVQSNFPPKRSTTSRW